MYHFKILIWLNNLISDSKLSILSREIAAWKRFAALTPLVYSWIDALFIFYTEKKFKADILLFVPGVVQGDVL